MNLTDDEKLDQYDHTVYIGEQVLKAILLNELPDVESFSSWASHRAGEARGMMYLMYKLTNDGKYNWTLTQLQDYYKEEECENNDL